MMTFKTKSATYNHTYKVIGKHPVDGRIFAVRHGQQNGLYVVDRDLNLVKTLNTTLVNYDGNGLGNGITECVILSSGTMLAWGMYRTGINQTVIWRSTDTTYSEFEPVFTLPNDITFIEKSVAVAPDDTIMCCEYTTNPPDPETGLWTPPHALHVWRGSNDGRDWDIVHTRSRIPKFEGDLDWIRHFHTVRYDPYENLFWFSTGDWNHESSISSIKTDGTGCDRVIQADPKTTGQQERTTSLMFTEDYVWFGSDSFYSDHHYVARINRATRQMELLDYLPDDCTRLSDKINHPDGDFLIMNKSYEKSPTNPNGIAELLVCDNFETGDWYTLYSWEVSDLNTVSVMYQLVDNGDGRIYVHSRRIKDDTETGRMSTTTILDIEWDEEVIEPIESDGEIKISIDGEMIKLPLYNLGKIQSNGTSLRIKTPEGVKEFNLETSGSGLKVKTNEGIRYINKPN